MSLTEGKRSRPQDHTPPTKSKKKPKPSTCSICETTIHDDKHQSIYCEGKCQAWFHRKCTGMSEQVFRDYRNSDEPFLCLYCVLFKYKQEIVNLKQQVSSLTTELSTLKNSTQSGTTIEVQSDSTPGDASKNNNSHSVISNSSAQQPQCPAPPKPPQVTPEKKFNLIFYGISESPINTPRTDRQQHDFHQISSILSSIDTSLTSASIKDFYRLGKFSASNTSSPRPILVKFLRTFEVIYVLSKRSQLKQPISIKPDMSRDERASEAAFLKERWNLIQEGTDRKFIKLRNNEIYINNKLHGRLEKSISGYYTVTRQSGLSQGIVGDSNVPTNTAEENNNIQMHTTPPPSSQPPPPPPSSQPSQSNDTHN